MSSACYHVQRMRHCLCRNGIGAALCIGCAWRCRRKRSLVAATKAKTRSASYTRRCPPPQRRRQRSPLLRPPTRARSATRLYLKCCGLSISCVTPIKCLEAWRYVGCVQVHGSDLMHLDAVDFELMCPLQVLGGDDANDLELLGRFELPMQVGLFIERRGACMGRGHLQSS